MLKYDVGDVVQYAACLEWGRNKPPVASEARSIFATGEARIAAQRKGGYDVIPLSVARTMHGVWIAEGAQAAWETAQQDATAIFLSWWEVLDPVVRINGLEVRCE